MVNTSHTHASPEPPLHRGINFVATYRDVIFTMVCTCDSSANEAAIRTLETYTTRYTWLTYLQNSNLEQYIITSQNSRWLGDRWSGLYHFCRQMYVLVFWKSNNSRDRILPRVKLGGEGKVLVDILVIFDGTHILNLGLPPPPPLRLATFKDLNTYFVTSNHQWYVIGVKLIERDFFCSVA